MSSDVEPFELYALRYARHAERLAEHNYIGGADFHDADSELDYFVWVARRGAESYLVDTGFGAEAARQRGRELLLPVPEALAQIGLHAAEIKNVIITHLHYDHAGSLADFSNATIHLQASEAAYATGPCMCHAALRHPFAVEDVVAYVRTLYEGRVIFHRGAAELAPGLSVHWVGGHTAGLQVVRVWTRRGWVVLASDATHLYGNLERDHPFPIVYHVGEMLEGYRVVRELADSQHHIIPGHDPMVMQRYPAASPELAGKVARLDLPPANNS
jgi:glyoxylase-like metal-dependent hydrolase (beta-lactamase superfamily II)